MWRRSFVMPVAAAWLPGGGEILAVDDSATAELAVIVHPKVPADKLTAEQLYGIFTVSRKDWSADLRVVVFNLSPDDKIRVAFDRAVLRMEPENVGRFWIDQRIRGGAKPPRYVPDPALVVRLVERLPGAIGYVPAKMAPSSVRIVARISQNKVVSP